MSTTAAAGGRGFVRPAAGAGAPKIIGAVAGASALVYAIWEVRVRAAEKLGKVPRTTSLEWQDAQAKRLTSLEMQANPDTRVFMNPHRHGIPPSAAVHDVPL